MRNMGAPAEVRAFAGRIIGVCTPYNTKFIDALKAGVPMKMWDATSRTWWFPETFLAVVETLAIEHGVLTPAHFARFHKQANAAAVQAGPRNPYAVLGLADNAPEKLVELAYGFWFREFSSGMGLTEQLYEVQEAYKLIKGGG